MLLYELAESVVVVSLHVDEFDAAAVGADVADDGGEMDFAEAGADFELNGIADAERFGRFDVGAAEADGFDANHGDHLAGCRFARAAAIREGRACSGEELQNCRAER